MKLGKKSAVAQRIWALALSAAMVLSMAGWGDAEKGMGLGAGVCYH